MIECNYRCEYIDPHLQKNTLRIEPIKAEPLRCTLKQPERMKRFDPSGFRWLASGGSPLHFKGCQCDDPDMCMTRLLFDFECKNCGCSEFSQSSNDGRGFCCGCHTYGYVRDVTNKTTKETT